MQFLTCPAYKYLGMDCLENTVPLLQCNFFLAKAWVFHCCVRSHRHGLGRKHHYSVFVYGLLPSNGRLLRIHNSCFERIYHNITLEISPREEVKPWKLTLSGPVLELGSSDFKPQYSRVSTLCFALCVRNEPVLYGYELKYCQQWVPAFMYKR
jgi:hypothetical protein